MNTHHDIDAVKRGLQRNRDGNVLADIVRHGRVRGRGGSGRHGGTRCDRSWIHEIIRKGRTKAGDARAGR